MGQNGWLQYIRLINMSLLCPPPSPTGHRLYKRGLFLIYHPAFILQFQELLLIFNSRNFTMPRLTVYVNGKPLLEVDLCPDDDLTSMACEVEKLDKRVNPAFTEISVDGQEKSKDQASPLWSDGYFENPKILWRPNHFSLSLYICRAAVQVPSTRMWSDYKEALESLEPELQT